MARSNSFNFNLSRSNVVARACQLNNLIQVGETPSFDLSDLANIILNSMLKSWEAEDGIKLWKRKQATLFTALNDKDYSLSSSGDHCTQSYVLTTLSSAASSGATTLSLTSSTGMVVGDSIGIRLTDGTRAWTTISTIPTSTSVTIPALSGDATSGDTVVAYTTKITRPLQLITLRTVDLASSSLTESQMEPISHDTYWNTPIKTTAGNPSSYYYDKQLDSGVVYVFPRPNNTNTAINMTYFEPIMDMDSDTDDFDFPSEWFWTVLVNLTVEIAYAYGKIAVIEKYEQKAKELKAALKKFDSDTEDLEIGFE